MDTLPDEVLLKIIQRISLLDKFILSRVNRQWFRVCQESLKKQEIVELSRTRYVSTHCVEGDPCHALFYEDIIIVRAKYLTSQLHSLAKSCPTLKIIVTSASTMGEQFSEALSFILKTWGRHLECFSCDSFSCDSFSFDYQESLPCLKHLKVDEITHEAMEVILKNSPNIKGLQFQKMSNSQFREMPRGLTVFKLIFDHSNIEDIFASPAAETLEHLVIRKWVVGNLAAGNFYFPNLRTMSLHCRYVTESIMRDFLRSLSSSPNLEKLDLQVQLPWCEPDSDADNDVIDWNNFLSRANKLKTLCISSSTLRHGSIDKLVECCPLLEELRLRNCSLTDESLAILSRLKHLLDLELAYTQTLTEKGILALLKGDIRYKLRWLSISTPGYLTTKKVKLQIRKLYLGKSLKQVWISCDGGIYRLNF